LVRGVKLGKTSPIAGLGIKDGVFWDIGVVCFIIERFNIRGLGLPVVSERSKSEDE